MTSKTLGEREGCILKNQCNTGHSTKDRLGEGSYRVYGTLPRKNGWGKGRCESDCACRGSSLPLDAIMSSSRMRGEGSCHMLRREWPWYLQHQDGLAQRVVLYGVLARVSMVLEGSGSEHEITEPRIEPLETISTVGSSRRSG